MFDFIIILGKTKSVEWRIKQLKGLMKMYEENDTLFYDALDKDLRKPKWESMAAEVENNKNDIIGALRCSFIYNIPQIILVKFDNVYGIFLKSGKLGSICCRCAKIGMTSLCRNKLSQFSYHIL